MKNIVWSAFFFLTVSCTNAQSDTSASSLFKLWTTQELVNGGRIDAIRHLGGSTVMCATRGKNRGQLFISNDYGLNWRLVAKPTTSEITCIAETGDPKTAYILTGHAEVYGTTDGGATWTHLATLTTNNNTDGYAAAYSIMYTPNGTLLVTDTRSTGGHIYRSTDKGQTWSDLGVISKDALYRLEKVGNGIIVNGWAGAVYKSIDDGLTWNKLQQLADTALFATEYLGLSRVLQADQAGDLYVSENLGYTWVKTGNLKDAADDFINIGYGAVYYSTYTGKREVYYSLDYGKNWQSTGVLPTTANDWLDHGIRVETADSIIVLAGTSKGYIVRNAFDKEQLYALQKKQRANFATVPEDSVIALQHIMDGYLFHDNGLNEPEDVLVHRGYAYVPCRDGNNVAIIDYRHPAAPRLVYSLRDPDILDAFSVAAKDNYLYVLSMTNCRISVFDINNPGRPMKVGALTVGGEGSYLHTYKSNYTRLRKICVEGNYAYVTHSSESKVYILDIANPKAPVIVSSFHTGDGAFAVIAKGDALFLAGYGPGSSVIAVDVSDKKHPVIRSRIYDSVLLKGTCALAYENGYLYVTAYNAGTFWVMEVNDSLQLKVLSYISHPHMRGPGRVVVRKRTAFVLNSGNDSVAAIDIGKKEKPVIKYFIQDPLIKVVYGIAVDGDKLLVAARDAKTFSVLDLDRLTR